jgi:hypothetical protein
VWNQNRQGTANGRETSGGVIGTFNVQGVAWNFDTHENQVLTQVPPVVTAIVKPHDVESLRSHQGPFAVWSQRKKSLNVLGTGDSTIETRLEPRQWEIFTIEPVQQNGYVKWAPIGLADMLNSGGAVIRAGLLEQTLTTMNSTVGEDAGDGFWRQTTTAEITARGPGRFVGYCSPAPSSIMIDNDSGIPSKLDFSHDEESGLLEFILPFETKDGVAHQVTVVWDHP